MKKALAGSGCSDQSFHHVPHGAWPIPKGLYHSSARKILQKGDSCCILSLVQMPQQLKTLDGLLAQAEHYANHPMRDMGRVPPMLKDL